MTYSHSSQPHPSADSSHPTSGSGSSHPVGASPHPPTRSGLGLPIVALIGLALLSVPRFVLHDLHLISEGTWVNALLAFIPPAIWIAIVVWRRVPHPFLTLLVVGAISGVLLALGHQLLWNEGFTNNPPVLGGRLASIDPGLQAFIVRFFAVLSSLFTGIIVGAISGLIAWGISAIRRRR